MLIAALAIAGQALGYVLSITIARALGVEGFEAYAVAAAAFVLMVAIVPCGLEKYAVRLMPALVEKQDWPRAHGFLRFGLRWIALSASTLATLVGLWAWLVADVADAVRLALIVSCLSLPAGALAHFGVEVLAASGREALATAIVRIAVPAATLAIVALLLVAPFAVSGAAAIAAWLAAWVASLPVLAVAVRRATPAAVFAASPVEDGRAWLADATPFWLHRGAMALMGQASVLMLEALQPSGAAVAAYAAAIATTTPAVIAVATTNRVYARRLAIMLARADLGALDALRFERLRWAVPVIAVYLAVTILFAPQILGLFGPAFVEDGVTALRLSAVASAFVMAFTLAPTYLKYTRKGRATLATIALATAGQLVLLILLVPGLGATGAALANALALIGMYGAFALLAWRDLARLRAKPTASR